MKTKILALLIVVLLLQWSINNRPVAAEVQVDVTIELPVFKLPAPPVMVVIPGTYAYYAPDADVDILFYQGRWYRSWGDRWYWGKGYNGPWTFAGPTSVPEIFFNLHPGWRQRIVIRERISHDDFHRNWRNWERKRYWEHKREWWNHDRDEWRERKHEWRNHKGEWRVYKEKQRERKAARRDRRDSHEHREEHGKHRGHRDR